MIKAWKHLNCNSLYVPHLVAYRAPIEVLLFDDLSCWFDGFFCCSAHCGWMMQIQTQWEECFTLWAHSGAELCTARVQSQRSKNPHKKRPSRFACHGTLYHVSWWMTHKHKGTFTSQRSSESALSVRARMSGFAFSPLINGLHYLVLLNFILSGSLQDIEQALPLTFLQCCVSLFAGLYPCCSRVFAVKALRWLL